MCVLIFDGNVVAYEDTRAKSVLIVCIFVYRHVPSSAER
jgi:hypothetical protein